MKRLVLMIFPALISVMWKNVLEYIKCAAILVIIVVCANGCNKAIVEDEVNYVTYDNSPKIKQISYIVLSFSNTEISYKHFENSDEVWYIESVYEYDNFGRISKISCPGYNNGEIIGIISYDEYFYNSKNQLEKIMNYNANANVIEGFINLITYTYLYDNHGNKIKETIEYPQRMPQNQTDITLYFYENNRLKREEIYNGGVFNNGLITYIEYEYDNQGYLVKETNFSATDNNPYRFSLHSVQNGLNLKTEIFNYSNNIKIREIRRYYDENDNLIYVESQELSAYSSALSYISKYEYYDALN